MAFIFHITTSANWAAAQAQGNYTADSLASEGFIHCTSAGQVVATANHYYSARPGLLLLAITPAKVNAEKARIAS